MIVSTTHPLKLRKLIRKPSDVVTLVLVLLDPKHDIQQSFVERVGSRKSLPQLKSNGPIFHSNHFAPCDIHIFLDDGDEMFLEIMENGFFKLRRDLRLMLGLV